MAQDLVLGKTVTLTTDGTVFTPNLPVQLQRRNVITHKGPPQAWVVSMNGIVEEKGVDPSFGFPLACFIVNWTIGGAGFQTRVDGNSDQFLGLIAEQVVVDATWDEENGATDLNPLVTPPGFALNYPKKASLSASLAPSQGLVTKAFRTRLLTLPLPKIAIPYAAKGFRILAPGAPPGSSLWLGVVSFTTAAGTFVIDSYSAANVAAAHAAGIYLPVPSDADAMQVVPTGVDPGFGAVEFLLEM